MALPVTHSKSNEFSPRIFGKKKKKKVKFIVAFCQWNVTGNKKMLAALCPLPPPLPFIHPLLLFLVSPFLLLGSWGFLVDLWNRDLRWMKGQVCERSGHLEYSSFQWFTAMWAAPCCCITPLPFLLRYCQVKGFCTSALNKEWDMWIKLNLYIHKYTYQKPTNLYIEYRKWNILGQKYTCSCKE